DRGAGLRAAPGFRGRLGRAAVAGRDHRRVHPGSRLAALTGRTHSGESGILISMSNTTPPEVFILIPGRTSRQGTTLNEGKFTASYVDETSTLMMNSTDMARLGLSNGARVRLRSEQGQVELACQAAKAGELPPGLR